MCSVLGLFVWQSRPRSARARVLVANHVTPFDHNVLGLLASCSAVSGAAGLGREGTAGGGIPAALTAPRPSPPQPVLNGAAGFVCWSRGFLELAGAESRAELLESLKGYCSQGGNPPLLLFPEEATTNGRVGLLRFRWARRGARAGAVRLAPIIRLTRCPFPLQLLALLHCGCGAAVGSAGLEALRGCGESGAGRRPWGCLAVALQQPPFSLPFQSVAGTSWVTELLWTFFVPVTVYQVRY